MLVFDFSADLAKVFVEEGKGPPILRMADGVDDIKGVPGLGPNARLVTPACLYLTSPNNPKKAWKVASDPEGYRLSQRGRFQMRSYPGGWAPKPLTGDFSITTNSADWVYLTFEAFGFNQDVSFKVFDREEFVLKANKPTTWVFRNLDRVPAVGLDGLAPPLTRFDRLDTFEIG